MTLFHFTVPPLPHYIASGYTKSSAGFKHPSRYRIGVFDLLVVTEGCLFMGEGDSTFEVRAGEALILGPDNHHYATKECEEPSAYYWLHFQTTGRWAASDEYTPRIIQGREPHGLNPQIFTTQTFIKQVPQYTRLLQPAKVVEQIQQLMELGHGNHLGSVSWKQQVLFQEIIEQLSASIEMQGTTPTSQCAELAASYLRKHYREDIKAQQLGESINFHPVYIARCMQKEFGCSPFDFLLRFRIQQSKLLLVQTNYTIARVAEEVGFNSAAYFTSCFAKYEGISPRKYRQRFSHG